MGNDAEASKAPHADGNRIVIQVILPDDHHYSFSASRHLCVGD